MRTFTGKTKLTQSAKASSINRGNIAEGYNPYSNSYLQRTIGNLAVTRLLQTNATEPESGLAGRTSPHFGHVFSTIPIAHEPTPVVQQSQSRRLMRAPNDPPSKPPVPKPGHTPFNFISESPALMNWKVAVKEMLEREFKMKFGSFEEAQKHFQKHLQGLPSDSAREDFADRMRDRARKAFYRQEGGNPSYAYKEEDIAKLKKGAAPASGMQLEHMEDVKSKQRGGTFIKGRPERALDPGNIYVTEGGPGGTAPTGTKHAEKYRTIEDAKQKSREIRDRSKQTVVEPEAPTKPPAATTKAPTPQTPPVRPTSAWKAGLKMGGKALATALIFSGLDYLVRRKLYQDLEKSIDEARHGAMPWAQRVKSKDPSKPVYMRVMIESADYSRYVPFLGWMPESPVLHMTQLMMVREEIDPPLVDVQDRRLDLWRPGITTTVTYTELMVP